MKETKPLYMSKHALTSGAVELRFFDPHTDDPLIFYGVSNWHGFKLGRDVHETAAEALAAVEKDRQKKIASLRKQLARLENLEITVKEME